MTKQHRVGEEWNKDIKISSIWWFTPLVAVTAVCFKLKQGAGLHLLVSCVNVRGPRTEPTPAALPGSLSGSWWAMEHLGIDSACQRHKHCLISLCHLPFLFICFLENGKYRNIIIWETEPLFASLLSKCSQWLRTVENRSWGWELGPELSRESHKCCFPESALGDS